MKRPHEKDWLDLAIQWKEFFFFFFFFPFSEGGKLAFLLFYEWKLWLAGQGRQEGFVAVLAAWLAVVFKKVERSLEEFRHLHEEVQNGVRIRLKGAKGGQAAQQAGRFGDHRC